jgi:hypothetical protein
MNILQQGEGDSKLADGYYEIASRYIEVAIQTRDEMFSAGDTLSGNMNLYNYPLYTANSSWSLPQYMLYPEVYKLTISGTSYSAAFTESYQMYSIYGTTIGRGYDNFFCFTIEQTDRATEKICHQQVKNDAGKSYDVERHFAL